MLQFTLEQLFGSKVRVRILRLFLEHPTEKFYVREITRLIKAHIHSVRRELDNLVKLGLIVLRTDEKAGVQTNRRYFEVSQNFVLFSELRDLILRGHILLQMDFTRALKKLGDIYYLAFTGSFAGLRDCPTDLLIVGRLAKDKCAKLVKALEEELQRPINYTLMTPQEFDQRKKATDRFIYKILESPKTVLIDSP